MKENELGNACFYRSLKGSFFKKTKKDLHKVQATHPHIT